MEYRGYNIVKSNRIDGWYMTECGEICGENVQEVIYDIDSTIRQNHQGEKITVYFKGSMGMGITKIEGRLNDYGTMDYAQYGSAAYVTMVPKRKRNARRYIQTYNPYMVILAGHGHPNMEDDFEVIKETSEIKVRQSKYLAFDPQYTTDADTILDRCIQEEGVMVLADYRKSSGFNSYAKHRSSHIR